MKSKKFIALAMLSMMLIAVAGTIFSQSHNVSNETSCIVASSHVLEQIAENEMLLRGELDQNHLMELPNVEVEIAQVDTVTTLMAYQSLEDVTASVVEMLPSLKGDSVEADLDEVEEETTEAETETEEETTVPAPVYVISCSEDEYWLLVRLVEAEAGTNDVIGRIMVADVVINRVRDSYFPNSVSGVIYSEGQFMPISTGYIWQVNVSNLSVEAVNRALAGEDYSQGATYFSSTASAAAGNWHSRALRRLFEYGGNVYYVK